MKKRDTMGFKADKATALQFIKFAFVGLANSVVMLAVYYLFLWLNPQWYLIGNAVGWIVSVLNAYVLNQRFTFKSGLQTKKETLKKLGKSYLCYGVTFCLSTALLWLEVDMLAWSKVICPVFNILITTPINFLLNKFWTFAN